MMKKISVIGAFGFGQRLLNGQTIKTEIVTEELKKNFGDNEIEQIDSYGGKKQLVKVILKTVKRIKYYEK